MRLREPMLIDWCVDACAVDVPSRTDAVCRGSVVERHCTWITVCQPVPSGLRVLGGIASEQPSSLRWPERVRVLHQAASTLVPSGVPASHASHAASILTPVLLRRDPLVVQLTYLPQWCTCNCGDELVIPRRVCIREWSGTVLLDRLHR